MGETSAADVHQTFYLVYTACTVYDMSSMLEREIRDQAALLARCRQARDEAAAEVARLIAGPDVSHVVVAARGSSDNAARFAQYLWGPLLGRGVYLATPSLYADGAGPGWTALPSSASPSRDSPRTWWRCWPRPPGRAGRRSR